MIQKLFLIYTATCIIFLIENLIRKIPNPKWRSKKSGSRKMLTWTNGLFFIQLRQLRKKLETEVFLCIFSSVCIGTFLFSFCFFNICHCFSELREACGRRQFGLLFKSSLLIVQTCKIKSKSIYNMHVMF